MRKNRATKKDLIAMEKAFRITLDELYTTTISNLRYLIQATEERELRRKWPIEFFEETAQEYLVQKAREFLDKKEAEYKIIQQTRSALGEPGF